MKHLVTFTAALALSASFAGMAMAQTMTNDELIAQAVSAAPE